MIFLLNSEYVLWEIVELARLHMCEVLKVPLKAIEAKLELNNDTLNPEFTVDADYCKGVEPGEIRQVIETVYIDCKQELYERMKDLNLTREGYLDKYVWNDSKEEKEEARAEEATTH